MGAPTHNLQTAAIAQSLTVNGQYRPIVVNVGTHRGGSSLTVDILITVSKPLCQI
jgi:hypothetical protein